MIEVVIKYWVEVIFGLIISAIGLAVKNIRKKQKAQKFEQDALKEGVLALLHDKLYNYCQRYIDRGYITIGELKNLEHLYGGYHALGGNGTGTEIYERAKELPIRHE